MKFALGFAIGAATAAMFARIPHLYDSHSHPAVARLFFQDGGVPTPEGWEPKMRTWTKGVRDETV